MSLWIDTDAGVVVCLGCCHSGVVNTLKHILRISGRDRVRAVIGGMHLLRADERRLKETVAALLALEPELIAPCHCTGEESMDYLKDQLKERVKIGKAGDRFEF
jgi:7,8-dihydropterin-6-yl-methyl-4-(beta-D-ribofuranosyl)aminobenzene 5'-phosphate synthase